MSKKSFIIIVGLFIFILIYLIVGRGNNSDKSTSEIQENEIYDLMMDTVSRNIIGMDTAEMTSDEEEFYYKYLYDDSNEIEMGPEEQN